MLELYHFFLLISIGIHKIVRFFNFLTQTIIAFSLHLTLSLFSQFIKNAGLNLALRFHFLEHARMKICILFRSITNASNNISMCYSSCVILSDYNNQIHIIHNSRICSTCVVHVSITPT